MHSFADRFIASLSRSETGSATTIPRLVRPWKSRVLLPSAILGTTAAILAYSARSALLPVTDVWLPRTLGGGNGRTGDG